MAVIDLDAAEAQRQQASGPRVISLDPAASKAVDVTAQAPAVVPAPDTQRPADRVGAISNLWSGLQTYLKQHSGQALAEAMGHPLIVAAIRGGINSVTHPLDTLETLGEGVEGIPSAIAENFHSGEQQLGKGFAQITSPGEMSRLQLSEYTAGKPELDDEGRPIQQGMFKTELKGAANVVIGETGAVASPVMGTIQSLIADPVAKLTGLPEPAVNLAAQAGVPLGVVGGLRKLATMTDSLRDGDTAAKTFAESWNDVVNPHQVSPEAEQAATVIREEHSREALYQKASQRNIEHALRQANVSISDKIVGVFADGFQRMPEHQRVAFLDAMEAGDYDRIPEQFHPVAKAMRATLDENQRLIETLRESEQVNFLKNYFPHIYKDSERAAAKIQKMMDEGSLSMEGAKSFLKDRVFSSYAEARSAGFEPVTTNPVLLTLMRTRDVGRYIMANRVMKGFVDRGLAKWVMPGEEAPKGMVVLPDKISRANYLGEQSLGSGHWAVQADAAKLVHRYFSPGLFERNDFIGSASRGLRMVNNFYNQAQLGFSLFHVGFVTLDSMTSTAALAAKEISEGLGAGSGSQVLKGLGTLASAPISPITLTVKGSKLRNAIRSMSAADVYAEGKDFHAPASEIDKVVRGFIAAGGIADRPEVYSAKMGEDFQETLRHTGERVGEKLAQAVGPKRGVMANLAERPANILQAAGEALKGPAGAIAAAEDKMMSPIFQELVPRMKLGVFYQHAQSWLEKNPEASYGDMAHEMGKIWDSVENRLGEMDLDRRFWNQTLKDTSLLALRAVGWNYGTLHELGGGTLDAVKDFRAFLNEGKMSYRMSYIFGLAANTAVVGSITNYVNTGQPPAELRDYIFPQDGHGGRIAMPTYAKEVYEWPLHPLDTVAGKTAPLWSTLYAVANNQDHYGATVYDPRFPWYDYRAMLQEGRFFGQQLEPFSLASYERTETEHSLGGYLTSRSMFGFVNAPAAVVRGEETERELEFKRKKRQVRKMYEEGRD